jgi:adenylate cyclase
MTESSPSRRHLAAIMFTDIVGFSALTGRDEVLALQLVDEHNQLLRAAFGGHEGTEIKSRGDGFHVEFPSALQAVNCAVEIQCALHERNRDLNAHDMLLTRIGIHLGDVDAQEGDTYGEAVNVAARIEPLAEPGGIVVSQQVVDQVSHRADFSFINLGQPTLKNIQSKITVFKWVMPWSNARLSLREQLRRFMSRRMGVALLALGAVGFVALIAATGSRYIGYRAAFMPPAHSVAVLPFTNMSGDANQDYFSDGISEELLNTLAQVNELQVVARTSSFSFKGKDADIATISRKLNVGAILQGSVRRADNKVRITAQLVNTQTGYQIWSQSYDRDLKDILELQTSVAVAVSEALQVKLMGDATTKFEQGGTKNPQAFDVYLRGRKLYDQYKGEADERAALLAFDSAIALDPDYALAHAARARQLSNIASEWETDTALIRRSQEEARAAAERAVARAPELGETHAALASVLMASMLDFAGAGVEFDRSLALSPGSALVQRSFAYFAAVTGRRDAAIAAAQRALALDGLNPRSYVIFGRVLYHTGDYEGAIAAFRQMLALNPLSNETHAEIGLAYLALKQPQMAIGECALESPDWQALTCQAIAYHALGKAQEATEVLAKLKAKQGDASAYQYAEIHAQWGQPEEALTWLASAVKLRDSGLTELKTEPMLDPLRSDARFQAIEKALHLP